MKKIFLTGATGNTGSQVVNQLVKTNSQVTTLVQESSSETQINKFEDYGFTVVKGDVLKSDTYENELSKADVALLHVGNSENQLDIEKSYIDTAKKSGLKHLVKFSAFRADENSPSEILAVHGKSENYIKNSSIPYTMVRPNFFMQNILMQADAIKTQNTFYLPLANTKVATIDTRDVATFLSTVLTEKDHENKTFEISGPEVISFHEMAKTLSEVLGRTISFTPVSFEAFEASLKSLGLNDWSVNAFSGLNQYVENQDAMAYKTDDFETITGKKPATFRQFIEDHKDFFI
ncbi:SDR family oxidoreductase [uncultured Aquimarina sp.]|uniref:SDR family oxidoreductase n=1 Tax=uncultured Aquimarina sp. TaxID=575652 RepID=UPI002611692C|nr:SDR family oxidoreductase [uncultured Aquimarina sp.]